MAEAKWCEQTSIQIFATMLNICYYLIMSYEQAFKREPDQKNKAWENALKLIQECRDRLGKPIDENIKEAIVALNLLGINTTASCEGHLARGTYAPYIDIQTKDIYGLDNKLKQSIREEDAKVIIEEIKRKNLEEREKLSVLLEEFYTSKQSSFDTRLTIQSLSRGWSRLESQGAGLQLIQTEEIKKEKLEKYKIEMNEFTSFLKQKFLEGY